MHRERTAQLLCGAIAGPLLASAFTAISATRAGYDWERLPVSFLAIGRHGWLQRMNFVVAGVLYSCAGARYQSKQTLPGSARAAPVNSSTTVGHLERSTTPSDIGYSPCSIAPSYRPLPTA